MREFVAVVVWCLVISCGVVGGCWLVDVYYPPPPPIPPIVDQDGYVLSWDAIDAQKPDGDCTPYFRTRITSIGRVWEWDGTWEEGIK